METKMEKLMVVICAVAIALLMGSLYGAEQRGEYLGAMLRQCELETGVTCELVAAPRAISRD